MTAHRKITTLTALALLALFAAAIRAQYEDAPTPGEEPSSYDTLFEQSDLGNVAQAAQFALRSGQRELQSADKLARRASEATGEKKDELLEKRTKALTRAAEQFEEAIGYDPDLLDGYTGLGTALRGLGQYEDALKMHAKALQADANRDQDFRGWAQSMLGLNMLGDATQTYTRLADSRPDQAAILMEEMKAWLEAKRQDPGDLQPADIQRLADWIAEHDGTAG